MTATPALSDPRPLVERAVAQVAALIEAVPAERLGDPTPCADFDVRALLEHLVAGAHDAAQLGETGTVKRSAPPADVADDGWGRAYGAALARLTAAWADDEKLERPVTVEWGTFPGAVYLASGVVLESVTHAWDLSQALGHQLPLDQELAGLVLGPAQRFLPAERRGDEVPFGPVRPAPEGADAYTRLAAWLGREVA
ncbi:TIGR03086 family protein [Streptosporangium nondiastaticum]|uniref:TIGR03086 family protein n=1 Tax=Streptosporangium nondiastaticum TaxID=35764 RepID=A0A9X7JJI4_9ACTN|nr:TIGR03086 family metal-binding protein [Streptosporangium nondiastaticum]PSJ24771.1 TIGR03086 family protein [Streptosporangium nondiastaticum]